MISMDSMVDELLLIKVAEERARQPWRFPRGEEWKQVGKNLLAYGAGMGVGGGLGYALRKKVLPKFLPQMSNKALGALSFGGGALTSLAAAAALRRAAQLTEKKRRSDNERAGR